MTAQISNLEKRLAELRKGVPARGMERYPSVLKSISELSAELQSPGIKELVAGRTIQRIISFPPQIHRGHHYVPRQALLFTSDDVIHTAASIWPDQEPQVTFVKGSGLFYIRVTLLLLYGLLEIVAPGTGSPNRLAVEFNTVAWGLISRPLYRFLQANASVATAPVHGIVDSPLYKAVDDLPLKFSNGVRIHALLPGEALEDFVFQPGIWMVRNRWLPMFRRPITANTLLAITSSYMIVIQEELKVAQGWIVSYIPRNGIVQIQDLPRGLWNELTIKLQRGDQIAEYKLTLGSEAVKAWRTRWIQHGGRWQDLQGEKGIDPVEKRFGGRSLL